MCLDRFEQKRTSGNGYGGQVAEIALFYNKTGILSIGRYEGSMNRSLGLLGCMKDVCKVCFGCCLHESEIESFCKLSSLVSKEMSTCDIGLSNVLKHAAHFALDQWDLSTQLASKIWLVLQRFRI